MGSNEELKPVVKAEDGDHTATRVAKRAASGEPETASDAKRLKSTHEVAESPGAGEETGTPGTDTAAGDAAKSEADEAAPAPAAAPAPPKPIRIPFPEKPLLVMDANIDMWQPAVLEERNGEIKFRVVNNDGERESNIILTGLKNLFQKQLPKMPKDYIARLVYDRTHLSIAIVRDPLEVIGGIAIRPFNERKFAEIVFCAVSSDQQVKGYGAHLMAHLKDYVKATSPVMHFLTYADNYATGYFQKQGFTKEITLDKQLWMGYIKDYEGGTIMQCSMVPRIRYLEVGRLLLKQKETIRAKIRPLSKSHVVHQPPAQWANGEVEPIDPLSIAAIQATGWSPDMDALGRVPRHGPHFNELRRFLYQIQNHKQAWPFLTPVNRDEVPDYYNVIKSPMDLSTMEEKLENDGYGTPKDMIDDLKLVVNNCRQYNDATTVYNKCAVRLEKFMLGLIKDIPEWHDLLDE
ncbi:histone acetyltransferase gcn5 [Ophiostoma piceae UAMH 11346]|uniref:histone acetyltransferase n=1 Tax=Ophiostoma piceae (strain UAMH 11346) TaxID=1262450 RepID=S3BRX5_OPHP1|nr:histone acetyltransferase gcn5 [Ophiostoma piceae UAMH 11346]